MIPHNQSVSISITVDDAKAAIEFYEKAFGAEVLFSMPMPDGSIAHADVKIGETLLYVSGEYADWKALSPKTVGGCPYLLCLRGEAYETWFEQAVELGAEVMHPMQDFPWGVRAGVLTDPFGCRWSIGTQTEVLTAEEIMQRMSGMDE